MTDTIALNAQPYHVQKVAPELRNGFPYFDFHESVSATWQKLWRADCQAGIYPFGEGSIEDFDRAFTDLIERSGDDPNVFYDPDRFSEPFQPIAKELLAAAEEAEAEGREEDAGKLFLRGMSVLRVSRFPIPRTEQGREIWEESKAAYRKGVRHLDPAPRAVDVPFVERRPEAGDEDAPIPGELWIPNGERPEGGWPLILFVGGVDGFRIDVMVYARPLADRGYAVLCLDCPGTGDNPAAPNDPTAPERWIGSLVAWAKANAGGLGLNPSKLLLRGVSMGGHYAMRAAHSHPDDLHAVVAQGGCAHHVFDPAWIAAQNQMEFAYALKETMAWKFGYRGADAVERYTAEARKFSLAESGLLGGPSARLLIINGMEDTLWPIEDCILVATSGTNMDLVINTEQHMGDPEAEDVIQRWLDAAVADKN